MKLLLLRCAFVALFELGCTTWVLTDADGWTKLGVVIPLVWLVVAVHTAFDVVKNPGAYQ